MGVIYRSIISRSRTWNHLTDFVYALGNGFVLVFFFFSLARIYSAGAPFAEPGMFCALKDLEWVLFVTYNTMFTDSH